MTGLTKFFRKHSRTLVLVFMSLLLVVFLVGDLIGRRQDRGIDMTQAIGTAFGAPVRLADIQLAQDDVELAGKLGIGVPVPNSRELPTAFLLIEEARRAGVRVDRPQVEELLVRSQVPPEAIDAVRASSGRSLAGLYEGIGRALSIQQFLYFQIEALSADSQPRLEHIYRDRMQGADVSISVLDSRAWLSQVPEPSEAELLAHFEEARNRKDSHTDDVIAFGYLQKPRVRVEYLTVDPKSMEGAARDRELRKFYDDHKDRYVKPAPMPERGATPPSREHFAFEEVKDRVREDVRQQSAVQAAQRVVNEMQQEARRPWDSQPPNDKGVRPAPPAESQVSFAALRDRFAATAAVQLKTTGLLDMAQLQRELPFGRSRELAGQRSQSAAALAFRVAPLLSNAVEGAAGVLRLGEPSPVVATMEPVTPGRPEAYQALFFRVVEAVPEGPPTSLDEVRTTAIYNWRLTKAHELARQAAEKLTARAREIGLASAVGEATELKELLTAADASPTSQPGVTNAPPPAFAQSLEPMTPENFTRMGGFLPRVGVADKLSERIFALGESAGPAQGYRTEAFGVSRSFKWVAAQLNKVKPIYAGELAAAKERIERSNLESTYRAFSMGWLNPEAIRRRTGFVSQLDDSAN